MSFCVSRWNKCKKISLNSSWDCKKFQIVYDGSKRQIKTAVSVCWMQFAARFLSQIFLNIGKKSNNFMCDTGSMWIGIFPCGMCANRTVRMSVSVNWMNQTVFVICIRMRLTSQALLFIKQIWYKRLSVRISMAIICSPCTEQKCRESGQHWLSVCVKATRQFQQFTA